MSKLENGFKLYTTNEKDADLIKNYKTLLRFTINFLERNSKIYEMFFLIVITLIHINQNTDDENIDDDEETNFVNFNEDNLGEDFDKNTYLFILSILYKFYKIFPSLVKFYYYESKNKMKSIFKSLTSSLLLPKMLVDLHERIKSNEKILKENDITIGQLISLKYFNFEITLMEEIKLEIEVKVPSNFPLKKLDIKIHSNAAMDDMRMMNITMALNLTLNSSIDNICDNLLIWKDNVKDVILQGNEPCPICYYYVNTTDKSLPKIYCHTCRKKFHTICITKWFQSQSSMGQEHSCPMCRGKWKGK